MTCDAKDLFIFVRKDNNNIKTLYVEKKLTPNIAQDLMHSHEQSYFNTW